MSQLIVDPTTVNAQAAPLELASEQCAEAGTALDTATAVVPGTLELPGSVSIWPTAGMSTRFSDLLTDVVLSFEGLASLCTEAAKAYRDNQQYSADLFNGIYSGTPTGAHTP